MTAAKPKDIEILTLLGDSMVRGQLLFDDIRKQSLLRDARKIPEKYKALAVEGLILILSGKADAGAKLIDESLLLCGYDPTTWTNYASALRSTGSYRKLKDVLVNSLRIESPSMSCQVLHFAAFWVNYDLMKIGFDRVEKYQVDDTHPLSFSLDFQSIKNALKHLERLSEGDRSDMKDVAELLMDVSESEFVKVKSTNIFTDDDGITAFTAQIETDSPDLLSNLNEKLIDKMIERGLEVGNCVAYFEALN